MKKCHYGFLFNFVVNTVKIDAPIVSRIAYTLTHEPELTRLTCKLILDNRALFIGDILFFMLGDNVC